MHRAFMKINFHVMTRKRYQELQKEAFMNDPENAKVVKDLQPSDWKTLKFGLPPFKSKKKK